MDTDLMAQPIGYRIRTRMGTWNVRTLAESSRLAQVCRVMDNYRLSILGLSEVRWKGHGELRTASGHHFIYSGDNENHIHGVGIVMTTKLKNALLEHKPISDRLIIARFKTKYRNIVVFQCYAPTENDDEETKNIFYEQLDTAIARACRSDIKIIMGDMNAKVGKDNTNLRFVMGNQGLGISRNRNGERLLDLCSTHQLFIGGTKFPHLDIHKYTWESPDKVTRNQIDHFLISRKFLGCLMDVRTVRGADIYSDHKLLIGDVKLRPKASYHQKVTKSKFNVHRLQNPAIATAFSNDICRKLDNITTRNWSDIVTICSDSAKNVLGCSKHHIKPWISDTTWDAIKDRERLYVKLQNANDSVGLPLVRLDYNNAEKKVKKLVRKDKRQYYDNIASDAEEAAVRGNTRVVYSKIRQLSGEKMKNVAYIKDSNGQALTTTDEQLRRWKEFFEAPIMTIENFETITTGMRRNPRRNIITTPPSLTEINAAFKKLKNNKAAGSDNLPAEFFKYAPALATYIQPLIHEAWSTENIPLSWKEGVIVTIPKKGDLSECSNWRGITLLNSIQKILSFIILDRIAPTVEACLHNEQAGFRRNRSCIDHINSLRIIVEQSIEWNSPLYLIFVDFERAFDAIDRRAIWQCLNDIGIPDKIISIIQMLYCDAQCRARYKGSDSNTFYVHNGVRQGCVLSPLLFLLVLDAVMHKTNTEAPNGIQWYMNQRLNDLDYADDLCLMSHSLPGIQNKINILHENGLKVGLKINYRKTKVMRISTNNTTPITVDGNTIENVKKFTYLGSIISIDGGADDDVSSRINKARHAYASLGRVWQSAQISKKQKIRIYNTSVKSVLLYGSETWKVTSSITKRLQVFVNKCMRRILRVFWPLRISNHALLQSCNMVPIDLEIRRKKWSWIGHTLRKENNDIAKFCLQWNPLGVRGRGRPRITWRRSVEDEFRSKGLTWAQLRNLARDRIRFREFVQSL